MSPSSDQPGWPLSITGTEASLPKAGRQTICEGLQGEGRVSHLHYMLLQKLPPHSGSHTGTPGTSAMLPIAYPPRHHRGAHIDGMCLRRPRYMWGRCV